MALLMLFGDGIGTLAYALVADYAKAHFVDAVARTAFYNDLDLATNLLGAAVAADADPLVAGAPRRRLGVGAAVAGQCGPARRDGAAWRAATCCVLGYGVPLLARDAGDHPRLCLRHDQAGGGCAVHPRAARDALQGQELRGDGGMAVRRCGGDQRGERTARAGLGRRRAGAAGHRRRRGWRPWWPRRAGWSPDLAPEEQSHDGDQRGSGVIRTAAPCNRDGGARCRTQLVM